MLKIHPVKFVVLFSVFLFLVFGCSLSPQYKADKSAVGKEAMVVTPHPLATEVGLEILRKGGNAADAAIAVKFAMAVVYPRAGNIGGGGFLLIRTANGQVQTLDFREKAPLAAGRDMFLDSLGEPIPDLSLKGPLAAGVPGTVDGMVKLFERHSKLRDWKMLLEPAIRLAHEGFRISAAEAERLNKYAADFAKYSTTENPFLSRKIWREGQVMIQPELAATLERIRDKGEAGFYAGMTAELIEAEMDRGGGLITAEDLINYNAVWREPVSGSYQDLTVYSMPPPSSGGVALLQLLKLTDGHLASGEIQTVENAHFMVEAMRRVYEDRARYLGDPDFYRVPVDSLLNASYLASRIRGYDPDTAGVSRPFLPEEVEVQLESFETTHVSIIDPEGNAISMSTTLNSNYGCKVVVGRAGFFLNNQMDDFSIKPGVANQFGLVGNEANAIEPGKRMLSSMTPTIVERDGQVFLVLGSPGGSTIITSVYQVILQTLSGLPLADAVAMPRFHHQWLPDEVWYERDGFSLEWLEGMQELGHHMVEKQQLGRVKAIMRTSEGILYGAGDPRQPDDDAGGW